MMMMMMMKMCSTLHVLTRHKLLQRRTDSYSYANHWSAKPLPSTSSLPFPSESVVIARSILLLATSCLLVPDAMLYFPRAPSATLMTSLVATFSARRQFIAAVS